MRKSIAAVAAVAALSVAVVPAVTTAAGPHATAAATKTVKLRDTFFSPKTLTVSKRTKIRFVWAGRLPHNIVGPGINVPPRVKGSKTVTARSGTYLCTLHPGMSLKIKVR